MKSIFVKISGDLVGESEGLFAWLRDLSGEGRVVICIGGGTQINAAFEKAGFVTKFGPLGREVSSDEEAQLALQVLEKNKQDFENVLACRAIQAKVIIPVLDIGGQMCHVNGDQMLLTAYLGYDELFVVTSPERVGKKQEQFGQYPKIQVVGF